MPASHSTQHDRRALRGEVARLSRAQSLVVIALLSALSWGVVISGVLAIVDAL